MASHSILWRRVDVPGHEAANVHRDGMDWVLRGCAAFAHGGSATQLHYEVRCDGEWRTISARVDGFVGVEPVSLTIDVDADRRWHLSGRECPSIAGCIDVDLNFSPSTNLLPIRRLELPVEAGARVRAAWLRFPSFQLEPLEQFYMRTGERNYRYESGNGSFVADLEVDELGFVAHYPGLWVRE